MSIAGVVRRGFGPAGRPSSVVRRGYAAYAGLVEPPVTGKQYVTISGLPWGTNDLSWLRGATPTVANGDIAITDLVTTPDSFSLSLTSTGVPIISSGGSTARQTAYFDVFDVSLGSLYGEVLEYVNNSVPYLRGFDSLDVRMRYNVPVTGLDMSIYTLDDDHDAITISLKAGSALPAGLSFASTPLITGTPTEKGTTDVTFTFADITGEGIDVTFNFTVYELKSLVITQ